MSNRIQRKKLQHWYVVYFSDCGVHKLYKSKNNVELVHFLIFKRWVFQCVVQTSYLCISVESNKMSSLQVSSSINKIVSQDRHKNHISLENQTNCNKTQFWIFISRQLQIYIQYYTQSQTQCHSLSRVVVPVMTQCMQINGSLECGKGPAVLDVKPELRRNVFLSMLHCNYYHEINPVNFKRSLKQNMQSS